MKAGARARGLLSAAVILVMSCGTHAAPDLSPGVSLDLARYRAATISDLRYELAFSVPENIDERVSGKATLRFTLAQSRRPLVLDFDGSAADLIEVRVGDRAVTPRLENGHIVIPARHLAEGENAVGIDFLAADGPLNRSDSYLYTLLVPDRASEVFPSFDQPDLKARFTLELEVPEAWQAVANALELSRRHDNGRVRHEFAESEPISTYLFAFAAGELLLEEARQDGRGLRLFHRETEAERVARNRSAIFDLHAESLRWLEEYTGIAYPFEKLDLVLLPAFQYSGMEHPGAIFYRASSLFLDDPATQAQELGRASLIAHEVAHMWFGNLVTMEWFDDVWTKEVFANFMAAKIVHPSFPELDHDLRFVLAHHPSAYEVDRTAGANPIRQPLENLAEAGLLYGPIIYQKAPIMMRQLERIVGEAAFRDGLREYLRTYQYGNASWPDLIGILDRRSGEDLAGWSRVWVEEPGRPRIRAHVEEDGAGRIRRVIVQQQDPAGAGRIWAQWLDVALGYADSVVVRPVYLGDTAVEVPEVAGLPRPGFVLPDGAGYGYGHFQLDAAGLDWLLRGLERLPDDRLRALAWLAVWEAVLEGESAPADLLDVGARALRRATEDQFAERVIRDMTTAFWRFLPPDRQRARAPELERLFWDLLEAADRPRTRAMYFDAFRSVALTDAAVARLRRLWADEETVPGLRLSEEERTTLALELAVRLPDQADAILAEQHERIRNPDRRERFAFLIPALSPDPAAREGFFAGLAEERNRRREPWVLEALRYLHHPLRAEESRRYIRPALDLLQEVHRTGDIFFPARWVDANLTGHASSAAADDVRAFLHSNPDYPARLREKILQSADGLFRAAAIRDRVRAGG